MRHTIALVFGVVVGSVTLVAFPLAAQEQSWNRTLERISSGVVSIQIDSTRAFDTERNSSSQATGFVVDARARADPHESPRRHAGTGARPGRVPQSRGSRARAGVSRSHSRLRLLQVRPEAAAVHEAHRAQARAGSGADRPRHSRRRQRRGRAALDSRRHDRAARPPGAELRPRQLQRLQHVLSASRVRHVGRLVGLARRRHRGPRGGAERRCQHAGRVELLPAARPRRRWRSRGSRLASPCRAAR